MESVGATVLTSRRTDAAHRTLTVVVPAKNEAENIGWVLGRLPASVDEVVLVDANSTDSTIEVARRARVDIVVISDNGRGKGDALRAGVTVATGDDVVMIDADGSMDPAEIDAFVAKLRAGHDLVKGSRFLPGAGTADMTIVRDAGHRVLLMLSNLLYRTSRTDLCYGFAAFRRDAFLALELTADGFEIEAQLFLRAHIRGLRIAEVPSFEAPRRTGASNLNTFRDGWRVLMTILAERLPRRLRSTSRRDAGRAALASAAEANPVIGQSPAEPTRGSAREGNVPGPATVTTAATALRTFGARLGTAQTSIQVMAVDAPAASTDDLRVAGH